jgi:hypothetical protein
MLVCRTCACLFGPFTDDWHESVVLRHQDCACQRLSSSGRDQSRWPWFDFNRCVELCYCCAGQVIRTGSKWSVFFCEDCCPAIIALNRSYGVAVIPYGRHSLMNGFGISGEDAKHPGKVAVFAAGFNTFVERINRLHNWRRNLVRDYLAAMGESGDVSAETYLAAALKGSPGKAEIFRQMSAYFGVEV